MSYLRSWANSLARAEVNCRPQSDIRESCNPKRLKTWLKKSFPTLATSMVFEYGVIITPFIRLWLTTTIMESIPCTLERSLTRSTESCLKGREDVEAMGFNGGWTRWVFTLFCWPMAHPLMNLLT